MSEITIELRKVVEMVGVDNLGLSDYPIFDEDYRPILNEKIINHFWYREIGHETIDQFAHQMRVKMMEIMPFFNKMYLAELENDPLSTHDLRTLTKSNTVSDATAKTSVIDRMNGVSKSDDHGKSQVKTGSENTSTSSNVNYNFPQTRLAGNEDYADSGAEGKAGSVGTGSTDSDESRKTQMVTDNTSNSDTDNTSKVEGQSDTLSTTTGRIGHAPELIARYRSLLVNIDMMVIEAVSELFMQIWNSNDTYTDRWYYGYGI